VVAAEQGTQCRAEAEGDEPDHGIRAGQWGGGAVAALLATVLLTRGDHPEPGVDAGVSAQPI